MQQEIDNVTFCFACGWNVLKQTRSRLHALKLTKRCSRCKGTGKHSFNRLRGEMCYECKGYGYVLPKLTYKLAWKIAKIEKLDRMKMAL